MSALRHYLIHLCVEFIEPYWAEDSNRTRTRIAGYFREFGVTAADELAAKSMAAEALDPDFPENAIDWEESEVKVMDLDNWDPEVSAHCLDPEQSGVWFKTGHAFFPYELNDESNLH